MTKGKRRSPAQADRPKGRQTQHVEPKQHPWGNKVTLIGTIVAAAVGVSALMTWASGPLRDWWESQPQQIAGKYDRTSPLATKCVGDSQEWKTFNQPNPEPAIRPNTFMRVNGSATCRTAWVFVVNSLDGTRVEKTIERLAGDGLPAVERSTPDDLALDPLVEVNGKKEVGDNGRSFTDQVYAPGCVWVSVKISEIKTSTVLWEVTRQEVCKP